MLKGKYGARRRLRQEVRPEGRAEARPLLAVRLLQALGRDAGPGAEEGAEQEAGRRDRLRRRADHPGRRRSRRCSASRPRLSSKIRKALDEAARDDSIKAVVLRVNSPGGSAVASEIILDATRRVKAKKPFVVSMGDVAGSGGYYVACASDIIFADEATITGSIGVVGGKLATADMWKKVGVTFKTYKRGENAGMLASRRALHRRRARADAGLDGRGLRRLQGARHGDPRQPAQEADRRAGRRPGLHRQAGPGARPGRPDRHPGRRDRLRRRPGQADRLRRPRRPRAEEVPRAAPRGRRRQRAAEGPGRRPRGRPCSTWLSRSSAPSTRPAPGWSAWRSAGSS